MMYKLLHAMFGWDYIAWRNTCAMGIARIYADGDGGAYYWQYKSLSLAEPVITKDQVIWLTCPSSKYLKSKSITVPTQEELKCL